jgi:hypothetical protein
MRLIVMSQITNTNRIESSRVPTPSSVSANRAKNVRYTVDLTPAASDELESIKSTFRLSAAEVFRSALLLMRIYRRALIEGKEVQVVDPKTPNRVSVIELPMFGTLA